MNHGLIWSASAAIPLSVPELMSGTPSRSQPDFHQSERSWYRPKAALNSCLMVPLAWHCGNSSQRYSTNTLGGMQLSGSPISPPVLHQIARSIYRLKANFDSFIDPPLVHHCGLIS